jgi:hypothetical protein
MLPGRRGNPAFSHAYSRFVSEKDDLIGLIAYALFKAAKVEKCRKHRQDTGSDLSKDAARDWSDEHSSDYYVELYKNQAIKLIGNYTKIVLDREEPRMRNEILQAGLSSVTSTLSGLTGLRGLVANVGTGLAASIIFIVVGYVIVVANQGKPPWPLSEIQSLPVNQRPGQ